MFVGVFYSFVRNLLFRFCQTPATVFVIVVVAVVTHSFYVLLLLRMCLCVFFASIRKNVRCRNTLRAWEHKVIKIFKANWPISVLLLLISILYPIPQVEVYAETTTTITNTCN